MESEKKLKLKPKHHITRIFQLRLWPYFVEELALVKLF